MCPHPCGIICMKVSNGTQPHKFIFIEQATQEKFYIHDIYLFSLMMAVENVVHAALKEQ